jgi:biopolymer transport protein ExbB/TolQ
MTDAIYQAVFATAKVLEIPVIILSLLSLAWLVVEVGAFLVEVQRRRGRRLPAIVAASDRSRAALDAGNRDAALADLRVAARNRAMQHSLASFVAAAGTRGGETRIAKELADFDFTCQRRLGRTRLLVRLGPALGLMGTLIPLSPALQGLAEGDVATLTENLRVAFSVTVLGILIGVVAFGLSLIRERLYGQDYSDLEYVAAVLTADAEASTPQPVGAAGGTP